MLTLVIWLLTAILFIDCVFLVLLVLVQLPKKEAGAGLAFGGGATDALFGAGSGTALTKITKYAATVFFVLALTLSMLSSHRSQNTRASLVEEKLKERANKPGATAPVTPPPAAKPSVTAPEASTPALNPATPTSEPAPAPTPAPVEAAPGTNPATSPK
jgi:preprotein translocase subunit SecG